MFGRGLFLSNGEEWRQQRRAVAPAFAPRTLHRVGGQVVSCASALADDLAALDGERVNLLPRFQRLALDIIGGAIFFLDMRQYGSELRELILRYALRLGRPALADFLLPLPVPTATDFAGGRFRRRWRRLIDHIIAERAARPQGPEQRDLFDVLAAPDPETGESPTAERLGDQVATIVVAGHETTAAAMSGRAISWRAILRSRSGSRRKCAGSS